MTLQILPNGAFQDVVTLVISSEPSPNGSNMIEVVGPGVHGRRLTAACITSSRTSSHPKTGLRGFVVWASEELKVGARAILLLAEGLFRLAQMSFTIGASDDRLLVKVTLAKLRFTNRGTVRVSARAIVRQTPAR